MLKHLQKYFTGDKPGTPTLVAETLNKGVDMAVEKQEGTVAATAEVDVAALQTAVASLTEQLAAKDTQIAELSALVEAAAEYKAAQEQAVAEAKVAARSAKLTDVVGTEQAAGLLAATSMLDEASFEAVVTAMSFKMKAEASSPMFKEVGVEGQANTEKLVTEAKSNRVMDYLKSIAKENQAN